MKSTSAIATLTTLAFSAPVCLSVFGFSQSTLAGDCPRLFKDKNLRGASFSLCNTNSTTVPAGFNDQISSLRIPKNYGCVLYTDAGFKGRRIHYTGPTGIANLSPAFNNKVSSVQCAKVQ